MTAIQGSSISNLDEDDIRSWTDWVLQYRMAAA